MVQNKGRASEAFKNFVWNNILLYVWFDLASMRLLNSIYMEILSEEYTQGI